MELLASPEEARRLARHIAADVVLYNDHVIQSGLVEGNLDTGLAEALQEACDHYESRVGADLLQRTNFLERAFSAALVERVPAGTPTWRLGLGRLRARLLPKPSCPGCRVELPMSRMVGGAELFPDADPAPGWRFLFACPACLAAGRFDWTEGWASASEAGLEATGALVARAQERLRSAGEAGRLGEEVAALLGDGERRWLLCVPEVFREARP